MSEEPQPSSSTSSSTPSPQELEKIEEAKLKAKYPGGPGRLGGHSAFLQKRLAKGQKFFDSGDYQMAKQKVPNINKPPMKIPGSNPFPTGETIPTPDMIPIRKSSIVQPSKLTTQSVNLASATANSLNTNLD